MNRRGFLASLPMLAAAAWLSQKLSAMRDDVTSGFQRVYFKNIPLTFDENCPTNTIYFIGKKGVWKLDANGSHHMM